MTGTRVAGRTRLDSVSQVDVQSGASLQRQGTTEQGAALSVVGPSSDFPRPSASDATDGIRPATLRGLSPDEVLVIDGIRGHTSALLNSNGTVTYFGDVNQAGTTPTADVHTGDHAITDLELRRTAIKGAQIGVGVSNLFDVYPDRTTPANNSTSVLGFPYYSPFGFNGRYLYARAGLN